MTGSLPLRVWLMLLAVMTGTAVTTTEATSGSLQGPGARLVVQTGHAGTPTVSVAPGGRLAATADWSDGWGSGILKIWNVEQGRMVCERPIVGGKEGVDPNALTVGNYLAWSSDARRLTAIRAGGGLLVWDLERCDDEPAVVDAFAQGTQSAGMPRMKVPYVGYVATLSDNRILAMVNGLPQVIRPFDPEPSMSPLPINAPPPAPGTTGLPRGPAVVAAAATSAIVGHSADGRIALVSATYLIPGQPWPTAQLRIEESSTQTALVSFERAASMPPNFSMAIVSPSGRWIAFSTPAAGGAMVWVVDVQKRRFVGSKVLIAKGVVPTPQIGKSADDLQHGHSTWARGAGTIFFAERRALSGMAFSADEQRLVLLRPRIEASGERDDPALQALRLPDLSVDRTRSLRGVVVPETQSVARFGVFGNALLASPDGRVALLTGNSDAGGPALAAVDLQQEGMAVQSWFNVARGIDALQFGKEELFVGRRTAVGTPAPGSVAAGAGPGSTFAGTRELVAWTLARGSASTLASDPYRLENRLASISSDTQRWLRGVDLPDGRQALALSEAMERRPKWTRTFSGQDGRALVPRAVALTPNGTRAAVVLDRLVDDTERAGAERRLAAQRPRAPDPLTQRRLEASQDVEAMRRHLEGAVGETARAADASKDAATTRRDMNEAAVRARRRAEEMRTNREVRKREAEERAGLRNQQIRDRAEESLRLLLQPRLVVLDANTGDTIAESAITSTEPTARLYMSDRGRVVLTDGEALELVEGPATKGELRSVARLPSPVLGTTVRSDDLLLGQSQPVQRAGSAAASSEGATRLPIGYNGIAVAGSADTMIAAAWGWGNLVLFDRRSPGAPRLELRIPGQRVSALAFSRDDRLLAAGTEQGEVVLFDTNSGRVLARLFTFADGSWTVVDAEGRFDTNRLESNANLHWVMDDEPLRAYPIELLMRDYYEPRLLTRILAGEQLRPVRRVSEVNRAQPAVGIVSTEPERDRPGFVSVTVTAAGTRDYKGRAGGVIDLRLFRNGQMVAEALTQSVGKVVAGEDKQTLVFRSIRLPGGGEPVEFSAYAFNNDRVKSETVRSVLMPPPTARREPQRRAFVVTIGVKNHENQAWNLRFAANDARRSAEVLSRRLRATGGFSQVVAVPLVSDTEGPSQASKAIVRSVLAVLAGLPRDAVLAGVAGAEELSTATPDDVVFVLFAGHGFADGQGEFYLVPADTGAGSGKVVTDQLRRRSISSDDLSIWMKPIDAGAIAMVIDACYSAAAVESEGFKPGPMGSRGLGQLAYDKGIRILTSSQANEETWESERFQHGLLTHALVNEGIEAARADHMPADNRIELVEWLSFGAQRVPQLYREINSGGVGTPSATDTRAATRIQTAGLTTRPAKRRDAQQPALFDFVARPRAVTVAEVGKR